MSDPDFSEEALQDARDYVVPAGLEDMWRLLMNAFKQIARLVARANGLRDNIDNGSLPLWCYGLAIPPAWLQPLPAPQLREAHAAALRMAETTERELRVQIATTERQSNELREALKRMYKHADNPDANLACQRSAGIASHFKAKLCS